MEKKRFVIYLSDRRAVEVTADQVVVLDSGTLVASRDGSEVARFTAAGWIGWTEVQSL